MMLVFRCPGRTTKGGACIVQVKAIPNKAALVAASAAVRFCNTFVGSAQWVWLARRVGLQ